MASIRQQGLRKLSPKLVNDRIHEAHALGLLSDEERLHRLATNAYAIGNTTGREDQVCLVVGRAAFDLEPHGLSPLLGGWGGEAIHGGPCPDEDPSLRRLGRPAVVVANVDLSAGWRQVFAAPSLAKVFVGTKLGLHDAFGEIYVFADIPGEDISDIWQPGHSDYDRHLDLPC